MYKKLLVVAALVITLSNVAGLTSVSAVNVSAENANSNNVADDKKNKENKKDDETSTPPVLVIPTPFPVNTPPFMPPITPTPVIVPAPADDKKDEKVKKEKTPKEEKGDKKVTICHRTDAPKNPYRLITVSKKAVDGETKNDHTHHTGPIATSFAVAKALKATGTKWGDIIPQNLDNPEEGEYAGKDILLNGCKYPTITPTPVASIEFDVVCEVVNQRAKITLVNAGSVAGSAIVNGAPVSVVANGETVTYIPTPNGKVRIVIDIAGSVEYDKELDCRTGGQGGGTNPTIPTVPSTPTTPTPVTTPVAPAAGQGSASTTKEIAIASLPYTAGSSTQAIALVASAIAAFIAIVSTIAKKAYLKQI